MSRFVMIAASVALLGAMPAFAAPKAATKALPFPMAADGTTNIADCAKADVKVRNECISKSRPVSGKQLYAEAAAYNAAMAKKQAVDAGKVKAAKLVEAAKAGKAAAATAVKEKLVKVKATVPAAVVGAPKGFKIGKDGTTNVADCAKAAPQVRNECISRARPLTGKELAKYMKSRAAVTPVGPAKGKAAAVPAVVKPVAVAASGAVAKVVVAPVRGKGFVIAKDGTTAIGDCAKANLEFRNECISRARPVSGKFIYASMKTKA